MIGIGIAVLVAACASESEPTPLTSEPAPNEATTTSTRAGEDSAPPASDEFPIDLAVADLADRTGITADDITVVSAESVVWNDGSLGCPQPGESYTQALVPGYRIVLEADDTNFVYHGADGGDPFLCDGRIADGEPRPTP